MSNSVTKSRMVIGMPVSLFWGYIAVALFMAGDGFEQSFLAHYIHHDLGIPEDKGSLIFSIYGLTAAISSWLSGVFAETFGAKRIMVIGIVMWIILHAAFMQFGIVPHNYYAIFIFYGLRGFAYPLFFYGFFYWVVKETPDNQLASAVGWIWSMFTIGYGIIGYCIPYFFVEKLGSEFTLWQALIWAMAGAAITIFLLKTPPETKTEKVVKENHSFGHRMSEILSDLTLVFRSKDLAIALVIRAICNFSLFGVLTVVLPNFMTSNDGGQFTLHQWQLISIFIYPIQPFTNVLWGIIGDRIGWLKQMRWVGFVGCGTATILLYYVPTLFPGNVYASIAAMLFFALTITSFVPMGAIFPMLAPERKGAAVSIQNLGGGLSQFLGNALVSVIYFIGFGNYGVFIIYGVLYYIAAVLTYFIKLKQPGVDYKVA